MLTSLERLTNTAAPRGPVTSVRVDFGADSSGQKVDTWVLVRKQKEVLDPSALGSKLHQYVSQLNEPAELISKGH